MRYIVSLRIYEPNQIQKPSRHDSGDCVPDCWRRSCHWYMFSFFLNLASRATDEFIFHCTHDKAIDWLLPAVPPTGKKLAVPMVSVVNVRGDRLYHGMPVFLHLRHLCVLTSTTRTYMVGPSNRTTPSRYLALVRCLPSGRRTAATPSAHCRPRMRQAPG